MLQDWSPDDYLGEPETPIYFREKSILEYSDIHYGHDIPEVLRLSQELIVQSSLPYSKRKAFETVIDNFRAAPVEDPIPPGTTDVLFKFGHTAFYKNCDVLDIALLKRYISAAIQSPVHLILAREGWGPGVDIDNLKEGTLTNCHCTIRVFGLGGMDQIPPPPPGNSLSSNPMVRFDEVHKPLNKMDSFIKAMKEQIGSDHLILNFGRLRVRIPYVPISDLPSFLAQWFTNGFYLTISNMPLEHIDSYGPNTEISIHFLGIGGKGAGKKKVPSGKPDVVINVNESRPKTSQPRRKKNSKSGARPSAKSKRNIPAIKNSGEMAFFKSLYRPDLAPARVPDAYTGNTNTCKYTTRVNVRSSAGGSGSGVILPNIFLTYLDLTQPGLSTYGGLKQVGGGNLLAVAALGSQTQMSTHRVVSVGIKLMAIQNVNAVTGTLVAATVPCTSNAVADSLLVGNVVPNSTGVNNIVQNYTGLTAVNSSLLALNNCVSTSISAMVGKELRASLVPVDTSFYAFKPVTAYAGLYNATVNEGDGVISSAGVFTTAGYNATSCAGGSAFAFAFDGATINTDIFILEIDFNVEFIPAVVASTVNGLSPIMSGSDSGSLAGSTHTIEKALGIANQDPSTAIGIIDKAIAVGETDVQAIEQWAAWLFKEGEIALGDVSSFAI